MTTNRKQNSIDFGSMLQDLINAEALLHQQSKIVKSVSFDDVSMNQEYNEDDPVSCIEHLPAHHPEAPILKSPSLLVLPDIMPMEPDLERSWSELEGSSGTESDKEGSSYDTESSDELENHFLKNGDIIIPPQERNQSPVACSSAISKNLPILLPKSLPTGSDNDSEDEKELAKNVVSLLRASYENLLISSHTSARELKRELLDKQKLLIPSEYALFEISNVQGIERPIRDWETIATIIESWDSSDSSDAIILKNYEHCNTLSPQVISGRYPRIQGHVFFESKPGIWRKHFCMLKNHNLVYYKEASNLDTETLLCNISNYEIYTITKQHPKTPTSFCFALKSVGNHLKECILFCVEKATRLFEWVLALRLAKSEKMFMDSPRLLENYRKELKLFEHGGNPDRLQSPAPISDNTQSLKSKNCIKEKIISTEKGSNEKKWRKKWSEGRHLGKVKNSSSNGGTAPSRKKSRQKPLLDITEL